MLVIHHLGISQSERILWLLEELELPYDIVQHTRAPLLSPDSLKAVPGNITGKAPFLEDTDTGAKLSESGAICEYILSMYGQGKLAPKPGDKYFASYLQFFHFANGTLQAAMVDAMFMGGSGVAADNPVSQQAETRLHTGLTTLNEQLGNNQWVAGAVFTAADIMMLYVTSTQRYFGPQIDLSEYEHIVRWMGDCGQRPGYQRAIDKGDPDMKRLLGAEPPSVSMADVDGVNSDHWKKGH